MTARFQKMTASFRLMTPSQNPIRNRKKNPHKTLKNLSINPQTIKKFSTLKNPLNLLDSAR
jgi:hypothetical protein